MGRLFENVCREFDFCELYSLDIRFNGKLSGTNFQVQLDNYADSCLEKILKIYWTV